MIEAFRMGIDPRPDWFQDRVTDDTIQTFAYGLEGHTSCAIQTLEGVMRGDYGDYIIKGIRDEIYPCKPDVFEQTYEEVEQDDNAESV